MGPDSARPAHSNHLNHTRLTAGIAPVAFCSALRTSTGAVLSDHATIQLHCFSLGHCREATHSDGAALCSSRDTIFVLQLDQGGCWGSFCKPDLFCALIQVEPACRRFHVAGSPECPDVSPALAPALLNGEEMDPPAASKVCQHDRIDPHASALEIWCPTLTPPTQAELEATSPPSSPPAAARRKLDANLQRACMQVDCGHACRIYQAAAWSISSPFRKRWVREQLSRRFFWLHPRGV